MSANAPPPIALPIANVQPSLNAVIKDIQSATVPYEDIWISCYEKNSTSVHGKVRALLDETHRNQVNFETKEADVSLKSHGVYPNCTYTAACSSLNIADTRILAPTQEYADPDRSNVQRPHRITAFDVSPDGSQFATGFLDGSIHLYPTTPSPSSSFLTHKQLARAHKSTVTALHFFPSSRVLLSAGGDFALHILPADQLDASATSTGSGPRLIESVRTLSGHTSGITAAAIIDKGRNVLSASRDQTVRLWDVGGGAEIRCVRHPSTSYSALALARRADTHLDFSQPEGEDVMAGRAAQVDEAREVETADKVVFCAAADGSLDVLDLRTKAVVHRQKLGATPLSCVAYAEKSSLLAVGSTKGVVTILDVRAMEAGPLTTFVRNEAAVEELAFLQRDGQEEKVDVVVGTEDGLAYVANVRPEGPGVEAEIIGGDCDAVHVVRSRRPDEFWTASGDGIVRRYQA